MSERAISLEKNNLNVFIKELGLAFLGSLFITLIGQIEIPLNPIPATMHTFAIFMLALFMGANRSLYSLLLFLGEATIGLPVFPSGWFDAFWITQPAAGYVLSFPFAAYIAGKLIENKNSLFINFIGLLVAQTVIYCMGFLWLSFFIGYKDAFIFGILPFVFFDSVKLFAALAIKMSFNNFTRKLYEPIC